MLLPAATFTIATQWVMTLLLPHLAHGCVFLAPDDVRKWIVFILARSHAHAHNLEEAMQAHTSAVVELRAFLQAWQARAWHNIGVDAVQRRHTLASLRARGGFVPSVHFEDIVLPLLLDSGSVQTTRVVELSNRRAVFCAVCVCSTRLGVHCAYVPSASIPCASRDALAVACVDAAAPAVAVASAACGQRHGIVAEHSAVGGRQQCHAAPAQRHCRPGR